MTIILICNACKVQDAEGEESDSLYVWIMFCTLQTISLLVYCNKTIDFAKISLVLDQ